MVFIFAQKAEVVFNNESPTTSIKQEIYKGAIALDAGIFVSDFVTFPIANHSVAVNKIYLHQLSNDDYKTLSRTAEAQMVETLKGQKHPVMELEGHSSPKIDPERRSVVCEMDTDQYCKKDSIITPRENPRKVEVKFFDDKYIQQWKDFEDGLRNNRNLKADDPSYGKMMPRCSLCGRYKAIGLVHGFNRMVGAPVRPWEREYMCVTCTFDFARLFEHIRHNIENPTLYGKPSIDLAESLLKIAQEGLDDPLAIATAKTYLGMLSTDDTVAISLLESAREFLIHYKDPDIKESTFGGAMESIYKLNTMNLLQRYNASKAHDKALNLLHKVQYGEQAEDTVSAAQNKVSIGASYIESGQIDKAEEVLLDSLKSLKKLKANPTPALIMLVQIYTNKGDRDKIAKYLPELKSRLGRLAFEVPALGKIISSADHALTRK